MRSQTNKLVLGVLIFIGILYITGLLHKSIEGFQNPWEGLIRRILDAQKKQKSYDLWIGYLYKNAPQNSGILNDFKSRVFQPQCEFRPYWSEQLPPGMNVPMGAQTATEANIAYKSFMQCVAEGNPLCMNQLNNARVRFMKPGCQFNIRDRASLTRDYRASFI